MNWEVKTSPGKWSVWLNAFFIIVIAVSIILVKVLGILSFGATWWDITATVFIAPIIALVLGIIALKKKDNSALIYSSVIIGILDILFILSHSLFISD